MMSSIFCHNATKECIIQGGRTEWGNSRNEDDETSPPLAFGLSHNRVEG